jgi:hypothetical protein
MRLADLDRPPHAHTRATGKSAVLKALQEMDRQLNKPSPPLEEAQRTLKQLDPAVVRSLRQAGVLPPAGEDTD